MAAGTMGNPNSTQSSGVVIRLNTNGTLDSSFETAGIVSIVFGEVNDSPEMAIQSDDKIVVAGTGIGGERQRFA